MNYRRFGDIQVSEIGLGTWQLGGDWSKVSEQDAMTILETFSEAGGNFMDTSDVYGMGISERIIGKFLQQSNRKIYVATKLGRRHDPGNGWPQNFGYDAMRAHVESSLKNLNLSQLWLEQLHCIPKEELQKGEVFDHLRQLQSEGLIHRWGASVETVEEGMICLEQTGLASLQIIFNIFRQTAADDLLQRAADKNVAIIVRVPLASGLLSGKFSKATAFEKTDHRNFNANGESFNVGETFSGLPFETGVDLAQEVSAMLPDGPTSQWALRWILDHPEVTTIIPGATKQQQVLLNMAASGLPPLSAETHQALASYYRQKVQPAVRGGI